MAPPPSRSPGGRPRADAGRSRRLFRNADRPALSGKVAVEQHLVAEHMRDGMRPQRLFASLDGREIETGTAAAEDDRRHHHVEAVEASRLQEAGDGRRAAFDKDAPQAARRKALEDIARVEAALR